MMGVTRYGTHAGEMRYALAKLRFPFKTLHKTKPPTDVNPPAILFVDRRGGYENHAVVYLEKRDSRYRLFDPMIGYRELNTSTMETIWHGNGIEVDATLQKKEQ